MAGLQFSVEQILGLIETLTPEQKQELQRKLPTVMGTSANQTATNAGLSQSIGVGDVSFGSGQNNFTFAPQQAGGNATSSASFNNSQATAPAAPPEMIDAIAALKAAVQENAELNPLAKPVAIEEIEKLETEIQKPDPDPSAIQRTVNILKQGLEGVQELAGPTMAVAKIVGAAFLL